MRRIKGFCSKKFVLEMGTNILQKPILIKYKVKGDFLNNIKKKNSKELVRGGLQTHHSY